MVFEKIYEQHKKEIYTYFYHLTRNVHLSEDLCEDTFVKVYKSLHLFRNDSSIRTWVYTIAKNTYLNYQKKHSTRFEKTVDDQVISNLSNTANEMETIDVMLLIQELPIEQKELMILKYIEGLSYQEIAVIMKMSIPSVKMKLHKAKGTLKNYYYGGEGNE